MRIEQITVQNFLGVPDFRHALAHPMLFVAGPNGSGKSSLQDAVRYALTGMMPRGVSKVADRPQLITEGAAAGFVQVQVDGYEIRRNIGSGKLVGDAPQLPAALALCLDPPAFAAMPEADRRRCLFELAGVQVNRETVAQQLVSNGIRADIVDRVLPLLRDGFPAAAAYAKEQASQARGAWKAITGENYGSQKAETWNAAVPENAPAPGEVEETRELVRAAEIRVQSMAEAKGRVSGALSPERRAELKALAATADAADAEATQAKLAHDAAIAALEDVRRQAQGNVGVIAPCPCCKKLLVIDGGHLRAAIEVNTPPPKAAAQIKRAEAAVEEARKEMVRTAQVRAEAAGAATALANIPEPSEEDVAAAGALHEERERLNLHRRTLEALEAARTAAESAHGKTDFARKLHEDVVAWIAAEAQLGPDGIPATMLARAIDPINDALAAEAAAAGFRPARIERDLSLTYAGRPYGLCSESERWRADALFAVVIAVFSDTRLVALDRFDVLDPASRGAVLDWLESRAGQELDTVLLTATLKAAPDLGDGIDTVWLDGKGAALKAAA